MVKTDRFFGAEPPRFDPDLAEEMLRRQLASDLRDGHLTVRAAPTRQAALPADAVSAAGAVPAGPAGHGSADSAGDGDAPPRSDSVAAECEDGCEDGSDDAGSDETDLPPADPLATPCEEPADAAAPSAEEADDPIAAKLARIRAVVGAPPREAADPEGHAAAADAHHTAHAHVAQVSGEDAAQDLGCAPYASAEQAVAHAQSAASDSARHEDDGHSLSAPDAATGPCDTASDAPIGASSGETASPVSEGAPATFDCDDTTAAQRSDDGECLTASWPQSVDAWTPELGRTAVDPTSTASAEPDVSEAAVADSIPEASTGSAPQDRPSPDARPTESEVPEPVQADTADAHGTESTGAQPDDTAAPVRGERGDDTIANGGAGASVEGAAEDGKAVPVREDVTPEDPKDRHAFAADGAQLESDAWAADARAETECDDAGDALSEAADLTQAEEPHDHARPPLLGALSDRLRAESSLPAEEEEDLARELAAVRAELQASTGTTPAKTPFRLDNPILPEEDGEPSEENIDAEHASEPSEDTRSDEHDGADDNFLARASAGARKAVRLASPARAMLTENLVGDTDASRLLAQTDSQLDEPEGNRRRSAIAHLRAAVAATRADRALQPDDTDAETARYREDLAKVVRPRRPKVLRTIRTERPSAEPAAAPLQLAAQQHVDDAPSQPVRPRRVSIADDIGPLPGSDPQDDAGSGFADYAASVGATQLPDLLEAAAAYMAFVEGRDQFSRPQLMTVLQRVEDGTATREERLRSFGRLLRDGKIEKTRGGRFTASERIGFQPKARQAS
ncbi:hypothetical protein [Citreimonas salinaria]|uniref:hypothetical protein n=1 Tax=Citreimonas salinaria TaxID=321339 RepID=UPI00115FABD9|nr:hypothetical protein [Citreimonas salinaria]